MESTVPLQSSPALAALLAVPLALMGGFLATGGGVFLIWSVKLLLSALFSIPDQFIYAFKHRRAILFSVGSQFRNFAYRRTGQEMAEASIRLLSETPCGQSLQSHDRLRTALIIPGTWSGPKYDWGRWDQCRKRLESAGLTVYGLCWESGNKQLSRSVAAGNIRKWLHEAKFPLNTVALIGHSYGGLVAAMAANHPAVERAVTIAAPFVSLRKLTIEEIGSGGMAVFSRFVLLIVVFFGLLASAPYTGLDALWPTISWSTWESVTIAVGVAVLDFVRTVAGIVGAWSRWRLIADEPPAARRVIALRVGEDEILDEMLDASANAAVEPGSSLAFVKQESLRREQFRKWSLPLYVWCVVLELIWLAATTKGKALWVESVMLYGLGAVLRGFFYVTAFVILLACARSISKAALDVHALMRDLLGLVDYAALLRFNRRKMVARLAGLTSYELLVHGASIEASHGPGCEQRRVDMPNGRWTLRDGRRSLMNGRHSKAIEDATMAKAVLDALGLAPTSGSCGP